MVTNGNINVSETFAPSSRSIDKTSWNIPIKQYFNQLQK
jgi:hypothetical protein